MLQEVADHHSQSIVFDLDDLTMWQSGEHQALADQIQRNTHHYLGLIAAILDDLMPPPSPNAIDLGQMDVIDVLVNHRRARLARLENGTVVDVIPPTLLRRYDLLIKPCTANRQMLAVRQVGADQVGGLVTVRGIVTRVTEVKPLIQVATYSCEHCGWEVYQEVTTNAFLPLPECPSPDCRTGQRRGQLVLQSRGSRFVRFQEARIQEVSDQVPMGHIPRSMAVHLSGDLARSVAPGDLCAITGIFMPRPYSGYAAIRAGLLTDTYLQAMSIEPLRARYEQHIDHEGDQEAMLMQMASDPEGYAKLARSIAPEIYGHEDVKKALLLLLVGGVTRNTGDGMRIRGDLNICLMGDPGVAKSQLLKWVSSVAPRAVYTTGKGSSGVGLTASVGKDPVTGEMVLEGGALVLADTGICCIDEFDKMEEGDRTAIHEVMEQQTISISKAGITTTLNARTSILAAANPLHGRYNPKRSPVENINLPPALLSRFDLMFLLLDRPDLEADTRLAEHVTRVHRLGKAPEPESIGTERISPDLLRRFIAHARQHDPMVPDHLADYITDAYVSLRQDDTQNPDSTYVTPRTLLGILRLSQALARLRFADTIQQSDVDEALRLMLASRHSLQVHREKHQRRQRQEGDASTRIYGIIKEMATRQPADDEAGAKLLSMDTIRAVVGRNGFTLEQLEQCLVDFDQLHLWAVDAEGTHLKIFH